MPKIKAIECVPHKHSIGNSVITHRRWSESGEKIVFMLENLVTFRESPDAIINCSEVSPKDSEDLVDRWLLRDKVKMSLRPYRR